jgi:hypothetical protein
VSPVKYELGFYIPEDAILHTVSCLTYSCLAPALGYVPMVPIEPYVSCCNSHDINQIHIYRDAISLRLFTRGSNAFVSPKISAGSDE